ncbi:MAG TPA: M48 family metallopeptidase [Gemmatimonadales bacterium]|nr:M48 family metallopeptidase [Gemmatimonadales bacterium]
MTATMNAPGAAVERWPTELPLQALCILVSLGIYLLLVVTVVGAVYALAFGLFFFVAHAILVAQVRGSAVRLGPDQFPELYRRVLDIATRIGLDDLPDAYLMQAGGALNAFATRFLGLNLIVLYSDLLEACGDDEAARDMIIAHELGHLKAGHVKVRWLMAPAMFVPFLGTALSRAREYTCDRYGLAGAGDRSGALLGLTILAAGGKHAPAVNRRALARQREDLATGWLTIGEWFGTHPPLSKRIAALDPALVEGSTVPVSGRVRALAIIAAFVAVVVVGSALLVGVWSRALREARRPAVLQEQESAPPLGTSEGR